VALTHLWPVRLLALGAAALLAALMLWAGRLMLESAHLGAAPVAFATGGASGIVTHTTTSDFSPGCTTRTNLTVVALNGGELRLTPTLEDYFDTSTINTSVWLTGTSDTQVGLSSVITVANGEVTLDNAYLRTINNFQSVQPRFFETRTLPRVNSNPGGYAEVGYYRASSPIQNEVTSTSSVRLFITRDGPSNLQSWSRDGEGALNIQDFNSFDTTQYHVLRLEWEAGETRYFVDGALQYTFTGTATLDVWVWLYHQLASSLGYAPTRVDWVRAGAYPASGMYVSCSQDAGGVVNWSTITSTTVLPTGTALAFRTRTSLDNVNWSTWQATSGSQINSPSGRYLQYEAAFTATNVLQSPELREVVLRYFGPTEVRVSPNPATVNPGATQTFTPLAYDANNQPVTGLTYTLALVNGGGSFVPATGVFTAQTGAGTFNNTISATLNTVSGPINGFATVTIPDLPPIANSGGPYTVNEGTALTLTGSGSDPNEGGVDYAWDFNNDGTYDAFTASASNTWLDNQTATVRFRVRETGGTQQATVVTTTVTVNNVAPTITQVSAAPAGPVNEGMSVTVAITATDPAGVNDPLQYEFDCDNNGSYEIGPQSGNSSPCLMTDNPSRTVNVRVTDGDSGSDTDSVSVTVNNVPPTINSVTAGTPRNEGSPIALTVNATDPAGAADPLQYQFDCNNDGTYDIGPQSGNAAACTFFEQGTYTVTVRVDDGDGGAPTSAINFSVANVAPSVLVSNSGPINEAGAAIITITASDPAGANDPLLYEFDCDNDGTYAAPQAGNTTPCSFADNGAFTVGVRVNDGDGGIVTDSTLVSVNNVAPNITNVANTGPIAEGSVVTITVTANDIAGPADPLQYQFDCDNNGAYEIGPQASNTAACTFGDNGTRIVNVRVNDGDGGAPTSTTPVTVNNVAPSITSINQSAPRVVGQPVTLTVNATDLAGLNDPLQYEFDCDNNGVFEIGPQSSTVGQCTFGQIGFYFVPVRVSDDDGGVTVTSATVFVNTVRVYLPLIVK
jgi:hypothetical protein